MPAVRIAPASELFVENKIWRPGIGVCDLRAPALPTHEAVFQEWAKLSLTTQNSYF
jgi:hypothetical protein